ESAIEDVLKNFSADAPSVWPENFSESEESSDDDDSWLEAGERDLLPLLSSGDPRHAFAKAQADIREHVLAELYASAMERADVIAFIAKKYQHARELVRTIPFSVAMSLSDKPNPRVAVEDAIEAAVRTVLWELSGIEPEGGIDNGGPIDWAAVPFDDV